MIDRKHCLGCRQDFYNGNNPMEYRYAGAGKGQSLINTGWCRQICDRLIWACL